MNQPKIAIIILHWNGKELLDISLPAIFSSDYNNYHVYLVENGSTDGSKQYLQEKYSSEPKLTIIDLNKNHGFAEGNNIGIAKALEDNQVKYIITLNNDTQVEPNWLTTLVEAAEKDEKLGSVTTKLKFFYKENLIDSAGILPREDGSGENIGFKEKDEGQYEKEKEVFGPCAGAALYRVEALKKVDLGKNNYFDRDFFAYYEDVDLAWRLKLAGYKSLYLPKPEVKHVHSSTGVSHSSFKAFHMQRNKLLVMVHNFSLGKLIKGFLIETPKNYLRLKDKREKNEELKEKTKLTALIWITIKAWASFLRLLPRAIKHRWKIL